MLDNPIWYSLATRQARFALGDGRAKRYPAGVAPFIAVDADDPTSAADLADLASPGESLVMVGVAPSSPAGWLVERRSRLPQMVCERPVVAGDGGDDISLLGPGDVPDMLALTSLAFPGYFRPRTIEMGTYLGIRRDGRLVAMAGQRMVLDGHGEISGVCTHPDHRVRGHARRLVAQVVDLTFREGLVPFLHVDADNVGARALYETLGFVLRRELEALRLTRSPAP